MESKVWHPYTRFSAVADGLPVITRGEGIYLYDDEDTPYVDAISSWWCANLGHNHPAIVAAIQGQSSKLQHSILGNLSHPLAMKLADRLADLMPSPDRHVLYGSDGASANEAAIKVAVQFFNNIGQSDRTGFVSLTDPYHGDTIGTVSVGYMESFHKPIQPLLFNCTHLSIPKHGENPHRVFRSMESPLEDLKAFEAASRIIREKGSTLAAVMVEPLCQGASGMRMYPAAFLKHLSDLCQEVGCLLIVDEIAMGCGRTGKMWAFEHAGIDPDIVTVGKGITAGSLPLSATIVRDRIYETFADGEIDRTFFHGHTFAGNPIACAAALAALDVYKQEDLPARAATLGPKLLDALAPLAEQATVKEVRGLGMIQVVEFHRAEDAQRIKNLLLQQKVLCRPLGGSLYLMLPLVTSEDEAMQIVDNVQTAIVTV